METVRVDTNVGETPLFDALQARLGAEQVVRERLDVGDVVLSAGGDTLLVERKTWVDLASSLTDGRYADQKARLLAAASASAAASAAAAAAPAPPSPRGAINVDDEDEEEQQVLEAGGIGDGGGGGTTRVLYLIEGGLKGWAGTVGGSMGGLSMMKNAQLEAALVLTAVRDGVPVLRTKDAAHTAELLVYLLGKLRAGELRLGSGGGGGGGGGYASLLKKRKRDNMTTAATWQVMLAQPLGMSARKAAAVAAAYPTMAALASATEDDLAAVRVPSAGAASAGRRLGPSVAKTLAALLR